MTRLDRIEPGLNEALAGDSRDTSTPAAMWSNLRALVLGSTLSPSSRAQLTEWLIQNKTGKKGLRAGLRPSGRSAIKPAQEREAQRMILLSFGRLNMLQCWSRFISPALPWMRISVI